MTEQPVRNERADPATEAAQVRRVVGLKYAPEDGLPQVILKGAGPLAEEILRRRNARIGPQVVKNEALLQSLYRLPLDSPPEHGR